jgi:acetyl esterase/lipase
MEVIMKGKSSVLAVCLFFSYCLAAQNSNVVPPENFPQAISTVDFVKSLALRAEPVLSYTKDVPFVNRDGLDLHLQIISPGRQFLPQGDTEQLPCIIYIQGSAWRKQNVYRNLPQLAKFAARGYVIVSVEYRHTDIAPFPAQIQDTKTAIRFMRKHAKRFHIDPENIFIWGDSSGGHTSVFAGVTSGISMLDTEDYSDYSDKVNAIIDYYGPSDIVQMNFAPSIMNHSEPDSPEGLLIGGLEVLENQEKAQETNPINYISKEKAIPPVLIAHGDMDRLVPLHQSDLLAAKLEESGKTFEYYCLSGAGHGSAEFWTNEMFDIVERFLTRFKK